MLGLGVLVDQRWEYGLRFCQYLVPTGFDTRVSNDAGPCRRVEGSL
jgi:hypothetical protein